MPVILRPLTDIACCPAGCGPNSTVKPVVTVTDIGECWHDPLAVAITQGEEIKFEWIFVDRNGSPIDLTGCVSPTIQVRMQELAQRLEPVLNVSATINPNVRGAFQFTATPTQIVNPGVYEIQFSLNLVEETVSKIKFIGRGYVIVERSMFTSNTNQEPHGPPPIAEILMSARAGDPMKSSLLRQREWDLAEVAQCIAKPVQYFNTAVPHIGVTFSTCDYPFEYDWRDAIVGYLMEMAALGYMRDDMTYQSSAPGGAFNDKAKWDQYFKMAQLKIEKFQAAVLTQKVQFNARGGFGFIGSPYSTFSIMG